MPENTIDKDYTFDLVRGIARFTGSRLIGALAKTLATYPAAPFDVAFNHKQIASKQWARDMLATHTDCTFDSVWLMGGWLGVLPAMLFDDARFTIGRITSYDIDPTVGEVACLLNRSIAGEDRFFASTADMYDLDYTGKDVPDLVINTSCEHIADLPAWLALLPGGCRVMLQSNNYFAEPTHINCVNSVDEFSRQAGLSELNYAGSLKLPKYTRYMLIGRV